MSKEILIVVSTFNRRDLTGITLDSIKRNKSEDSDVLILDDGSTEYDVKWLRRWEWLVITDNHMGVGRMAQWRFQSFLEFPNYKYILTLDNDLLVTHYFDVQSRFSFQLLEGSPLSVFCPYRSNTQKVMAHCLAGLRVNKLNGISQFTDRDTVKRILEVMPKWEHTWDDDLTKFLDFIAAPHHSLLQHLGIYGSGVNGISTDRAVDFVGDSFK